MNQPDFIVEWHNDASESQPFGYVKCFDGNVGEVVAPLCDRYGYENVHVYRITERGFTYSPAVVTLR